MKQKHPKKCENCKYRRKMLWTNDYISYCSYLLITGKKRIEKDGVCNSKKEMKR